MLDKEKRREYQRRYRLKKADRAVLGLPTPDLDGAIVSTAHYLSPPVLEIKEGRRVGVRDRLEAAGAVHPVVLKMFADLEKRVSVLEKRGVALEAAAGIGDDLFERVMAEKRKRLGK